MPELTVARFPIVTSKLRALFPIACDGYGPGYTCARLVHGMRLSDQPTTLHVNRYTMDLDRDRVHAALPPFLNYLPYRVVAESASQRLERAYLQTIRDGDIAWLWPSVSLAMHEEIAKRKCPIILEAINTRMASAKPILDAAYEHAGLPPLHGITDARIAEEDAKYELADAIFSPSPATDESIEGSILRSSILKSSYGTDAKRMRLDRGSKPNGRVDFLFLGHVCIRKGADRLLRLWDQLPRNFHLTLAGEIEPALEKTLHSRLERRNVTTTGFVSNPAELLHSADVFLLPSLEEGDPLVTYEAANAGLPLAVSVVGGGRLVADHGCARILDAYDSEQMKAQILCLGRDPELRHHLANQAFAALPQYDWARVAKDRIQTLRDFINRAPARSGNFGRAEIGR